MDRSLIVVAGALALAGGAACSDPASLPAQGGLVVELYGGGECPAGPQPFVIPEGSLTALKTNGGDDDDRIVDGDPDTEVSCTVEVRESGGVSLQASLRRTPTVSFSVSGEFAAAGCPRTTAGAIENTCVDIRQRNTLPSAGIGLALQGQCYLNVKFVNAGAIHADYDCDGLTEELSTCPATGTFVFENCDR